MLRKAADPDEPMRFGSSVTHLVPPADAANGLRPFRIPVPPAIVLMAAIASTSTALVVRPEFQAVRDALDAIPRMPSILWIGTGAFVLANLALIPLELTVITAGVVFGVREGSVVAVIGSLAAAAIGYVAGRVIGPAGLTHWMSRRSYRSARQLGARGVMGVVTRAARYASDHFPVVADIDAGYAGPKASSTPREMDVGSPTG
jgi:hypothetical protein